MSTLAIRDDQDRFDQGQIAALKQLGVENASQGDLDLFFYQCKRTGLDPFLRQTHMISRNTFNSRTNAWEVKWTIQTGIDGFRLIGRGAVAKAGETLGMKPTQWTGADGVWVEAWLRPMPPAAARVTIIRNGGEFTAVALYTEYVQRTKKGEPNRIWKERPAGQLEKCAEALAWRKAFPQDLSGLYTEDEMAHVEPAPAEENHSAIQEPRVNRGQLAEMGELFRQLNMG